MRIQVIETNDAGVDKHLEFGNYGQLLTHILPKVEKEAVLMPMSHEEFESLSLEEQDAALLDAGFPGTIYSGSQEPLVLYSSTGPSSAAFTATMTNDEGTHTLTVNNQVPVKKESYIIKLLKAIWLKIKQSH